MYTYLQDPGHGWLIVPLKDIIKAGVEDKISSYSYRRGDTVYLEEDCDMPLFLKAIGNPTVKQQHINGSAPCRNYGSYYLE